MMGNELCELLIVMKHQVQENCIGQGLEKLNDSIFLPNQEYIDGIYE